MFQTMASKTKNSPKVPVQQTESDSEEEFDDELDDTFDGEYDHDHDHDHGGHSDAPVSFFFGEFSSR